ncbi:MAG: iron-sulfur cluster carrier protein ApbC [Ardenticatenaceae bacterium]|nr:iron-sulfur cluster carrier protein ApbC [Ardenticatenaceae bacterium]HBY98615.1 iron-sulfur cluster carrier protein ApbC [Chloroflexota bacterium]
MFGLGKKKEESRPGITESQVMGALSHVIEPELHRDLVSLNMVKDVKINDGRVDFTVVLTTPACPLRTRIENECKQAVLAIPGVETVNVRFDANVARDNRMTGKLNVPVRNIVAVASGKGGVGKSTVSVNLAIALAQEGARVGLLDADIYGPNIPMMMGATRLAPPVNNRIVPTEAYGVRLMSIGFLVPPDQPIVWRGPMLHNALRQFLNDVDWGELDYLIVDMPPGTGDVQLSLAQSTPLSGGVIVTTPQDVALADARKGLAAFQKLEVPVLGIIENMSYFIAPDTGKRYNIFGHGGGQRYASQVGVPFLGEVPIDPRIAEGGDTGKPILVIQPESQASQAFRDIARQIAARLSVINLSRKDESVIGLGDIPIMTN